MDRVRYGLSLVAAGFLGALFSTGLIAAITADTAREIAGGTVDGIAALNAFTPRSLSIQNDATGNVVMDFRDYGDSADDDMAHVALTANCTTATTGAEDCDLVIGVATAGTAATLLTLDGDGNGAAQGGVNIILRHGASPPATCTAGEIFLDTDESVDTNCTTTADNSICICAATDTWATTE